MIHITLPWPPSVNHYWRRWNGRSIISREGRAYRDQVVRAIRTLGADRRLAGRLAVEMLLHPPDRRRRDIDNLSKALLDALQAAGVYEDDNQIRDLHLKMLEVAPGGRVEVAINEFKEDRQ